MDDLITEVEKAEDGALLGAVLGGGGGGGLGKSTDSRLRDRLRYSNSETCVTQNSTITRINYFQYNLRYNADDKCKPG